MLSLAPCAVSTPCSCQSQPTGSFCRQHHPALDLRLRPMANCGISCTHVHIPSADGLHRHTSYSRLSAPDLLYADR